MLKVLIINDNVDCQYLLKRVMSDIAISESAPDGFEGLEILSSRSDEFDFIVLDINMPRIDGFKVLSLMTEKERSKTIVMTVSDDGETMVHSIKKGCVNFLDISASKLEINHTLDRMGITKGYC